MSRMAGRMAGYMEGVSFSRARRAVHALARWIAPTRTAWKLTLLATCSLLLLGVLRAIGVSPTLEGSEGYLGAIKIFAIGLLGVAALAGAWAFAERARVPRAPDPATDFAAARDRLLRGQAAHAIALVQKVLAMPLDASSRALAVGTLGDCAELKGDFGDAAELFALALRELEVKRDGWSKRAFFRAVFAAKRAFALAAMGRLDEADTQLAGIRGTDDEVELRPLVGRARALLLAKRGAHGQLLELSRSCAFEESGMIGARSKALMRALEVQARCALDGAYRV